MVFPGRYYLTQAPRDEELPGIVGEPNLMIKGRMPGIILVLVLPANRLQPAAGRVR